jgi:hypothetical protein
MSEEEIERYYADVHAVYGRLPAERFPVLAQVAPTMAGHGEDERFEFGLDVLLAGLEAIGRTR